ncbi:N-formylglutamate amidohydrolase [Acetobacteraceae bacterium ESL0709]|nr:N-formylglutamate amidohydrolase [Acetobacteraceae bacterium ESL0697]MDF7678046.1 N-formylglutamate amidohydrolase [Acetobacteraceae bacterium ESL0709]
MLPFLEEETNGCKNPFSYNEGHDVPLLLSSPHSGRYYPPSFLEQTRLSPFELQKMEDRFVDDLLSATLQGGISLLKVLFPRSFCDVNRDWRELDARMFTPPLDEKELLSSQRVMAGYGVIPRCTAPGQGIYHHTLPAEAVEQRLSKYWAPFHRKLHETLECLRLQFGYVILFDVHSMPPLQQSCPCDIVLGNLHGQSCSPILINYVQQAFEKRGYKVRQNNPYAGGFITQYYGAPSSHVHALQIEISRALYLNQATLAPNRHYENFKSDLTALLLEIADWLGNEAGRCGF